MADYLLSDPVARLHFLIVPFSYNGMENFGLLNIKEQVGGAGKGRESYFVPQ